MASKQKKAIKRTLKEKIKETNNPMKDLKNNDIRTFIDRMKQKELMKKPNLLDDENSKSILCSTNGEERKPRVRQIRIT